MNQEHWFWRIVWPALGGTLLLYLPAVVVVLLVSYLASGSEHFTGWVFTIALVIAFLGGVAIARADDRRRRR